ncbi:uncharacterized protein [Dermacentor albipictus]|uniref:uncharacterized protein n=1 Tax=Dermacentor albipictus TaxID=60249 RepID=UPI0038FC978F
MPMSCVAYGCSSRDSPSRTVRFFRFPSVKRDRQRREAWIRAVKRQDAQGRPWQPSAASRLCGKHFVTGAPSLSPRHPDFIPTLFVYTDQFRKKDAVDRHVRTAARSKRKTGAPPTAGTEVSGQGGTCKGRSDGEPDMSCVQGADSSFDEEGAADALLLLATSPMLTEPQEVLEPTPLSREENTDHLLTENVALQRKVRDLELQCRKLKRCTFSVDTIHKSSFKFYTGLQSKEQFEALFKHIEKNAERMVYWDGGKTQAKERQLSKREELFMVLYRLRTGVCAKEVARIFGISQSCLSRIFCTWVIFLDKELSALTRFPTLAEIKRHMPMAFSDFSNTRVILDCTEVRIQRPSKLQAQRHTFSSYKHYNTFKALVGVTPDGYVSFVPDLWGGHVSDSEVVEKSGLLGLLDAGDGVMVDKGFRLEGVFPPSIQIHMPPFKMGNQLSASDVIATRKIAGARIHVERVIRRIKEFHFLDKPLPINMLDIIDSIFRTCAFLCNFLQPIISINNENK